MSHQARYTESHETLVVAAAFVFWWKRDEQSRFNGGVVPQMLTNFIGCFEGEDDTLDWNHQSCADRTIASRQELPNLVADLVADLCASKAGVGHVENARTSLSSSLKSI